MVAGDGQQGEHLGQNVSLRGGRIACDIIFLPLWLSDFLECMISFYNQEGKVIF